MWILWDHGQHYLTGYNVLVEHDIPLPVRLLLYSSLGMLQSLEALHPDHRGTPYMSNNNRKYAPRQELCRYKNLEVGTSGEQEGCTIFTRLPPFISRGSGYKGQTD